MKTTAKSKWWLDAVLFGGFIIAFFLDLTGVELHQWIGAAAGALAIYHLIRHWNWVAAVTRRFFGQTSDQARMYYLIDASLLAGFFLMIGSGLVISSWFNLNLINYNVWRAGHIASSISTLLITVLKLGLHWRWIVSVAASIFARPAVIPAHMVVRASPDSGKVVNRREFAKLMGVVGLGAAFALQKSIASLQETDATASDGQQTSSVSSTTSSTTSNTTSSTTSSSSSTSTCALRCGRRCSYPGHCRRYVDSNNNGRCDLGECS